MTPAQAAWLRKLRDEGPQKCKTVADEGALRLGWTDASDYGWPWHMITPAGLAALAAYEDATK
jgi:hypothetical protein